MKITKTIICFLAGCLCYANAHAATNEITDKLISSRFFEQPLTWVGETPPADAESEALWNAFGVGRVKKLDDAISDLENFIDTHPKSAWIPSLDGNLGCYYRDHGYFTLALERWQTSWSATKEMTDAKGRQVADYTLVNWLNLLASLGRTDTMKDLFAETSGRSLPGPLQYYYNQSRDGYTMMLKHPETSYRCGTYALNAAAQMLYGTNYFIQLVNQPSPVSGFSMAALVALSESNHLGMVAVERPAGQQGLVVPSVVHWKQDHYAAIIAQRGEMYEVVDPTFRLHKWLTGSAINSESSGQFLVADSQIPSGWKTLAVAETAKIFGKGNPSHFPPPPPPCDCPSGCPPGAGGSGGSAGGGSAGGGAGGGGHGGCSTCLASSATATGGMPDWSVNEPYVDLRLHDEPLAYQASVSRVSLQIDYWQRDDRIPSANVYTVGPNWELSWQSYIVTDGTTYNPVTLFGAKGGEIQFADLTGTTPNYYYNWRMLATTNSSGSLTGYILFYPSGAQDVFSFLSTDSYGNVTRAYLSRKIDAQGRTTQYIYAPFTLASPIVKLNYVIDPDGKTNTISYTSKSSYNYLVSSVQDPFGHQVNFAYDNNGYLTNVTDVAGLSSSFGYITTNTYWLNKLTTPYGTNSFSFTGSTAESDTTTRSIVVTEPNGSHQLFVYDGQDNNGFIQPVNPAPYPSYVPEANLDGAYYMYYRNSFYWGRQQFVNLSTNFLATGPAWDITQLTAADYTTDARIRHWNHSTDGGQSDSLSMEQEPSPDGVSLGQVTWYNYPNKSSYLTQGSSASPSLVIRVLPDGSEQYEQYQMDQWGNQTNVISTWSSGGTWTTRTNSYIFAANGIDLLKAIGPDGVARTAYGYDANHQVLFATNALNEVTKYTYNANEQIISITQQNGLVTTNIYDTNSLLVQKIVVGFSTNTYTYTNGLIYTSTDERNLTVTNSWDALQRLTKVAYSDGTSVSNVYNKLDLTKVVDRMGFTTSYAYNAIRQKIYETNALNRVTKYYYCECGALAQVTDPLGNATLYSHDNQGNLTQVIYPDGYIVNNTYNSLHQLIVRADSSGLKITNYFNNQGLLIASSNNVGLVQAMTYDVNDMPTNAVDANGVNTKVTYDNLHRMTTRSFPDGGVEKLGYTFGFLGMTSYTNQIGSVTLYGYDIAGRKISATNALKNISHFSYSAANDLLTLTDGKGDTTTWKYDQFGRVTNKLDNLGTNLFVYQYDADSRLTNRWSGSASNTVFKYDGVGNLTNVVYLKSTAIPSTTNIVLKYDAMNRLTNMVDAVGATVFSYDAAGQMLSEDGPWSNDTVSYTYANRLRSGMSLQAAPWSQSYSYDAVQRLTNVTSLAGGINYSYGPGDSRLVKRLAFPNGAAITNAYDSVARLASTKLLNSTGLSLDSYAYTYNQLGERTQVARAAGDYVYYAYDIIGELTNAAAWTPVGAQRPAETLAYTYDAAGNLIQKSAPVSTYAQVAYSINGLNQITSALMGNPNPSDPSGRTAILPVSGATTIATTNVTINGANAALFSDNTFELNEVVTNGQNTFTAIASNSPVILSTNTSVVSVVLTNSGYVYDLNGNLLTDGTRNFTYDDENQLISVSKTAAWRNDFVYDGKLRRRIERDFSWSGSAWVQTNEIHFVYDGNLVVQEMNGTNLAQVEYTRGIDLSGTLQGAGGIGGLLARSQNSPAPLPFYAASSYYHGDANGNITMMVDTNQNVVAKYLYDSFGNTLAQSGSLADANIYRFSSKEWNANSGLYYYLYRFYDANLQRWINRDPLGDAGVNRDVKPWESAEGADLYEFVGNDSINGGDYYGLATFFPAPKKFPGWRGVSGGVGAILGAAGGYIMAHCPDWTCHQGSCQGCCAGGLAAAYAGIIAGVAALEGSGWGFWLGITGGVAASAAAVDGYKSCMDGCAKKAP